MTLRRALAFPSICKKCHLVPSAGPQVRVGCGCCLTRHHPSSFIQPAGSILAAHSLPQLCLEHTLCGSLPSPCHCPPDQVLLAYCRTLVTPTPWCPQPSFHAVSENFLRPTLYCVSSPLKLLQNVFYLVLVSRLHSGIKAPAHLAGIDTCSPCPSSSGHASVPVWLSLSGLPLRFLGPMGIPLRPILQDKCWDPVSLPHCRVLHLAQ